MKDKKEFGFMSLAIDIIVCAVIDGKLHVLLVKRNREPHNGRWGLIGGFVSVCPRNSDGSYKKVNGHMVCPDETIDDAAVRVIERDVGITTSQVNLFKIYDDQMRDKRSRIMSACHYVMVQNPNSLNIVMGNSVSSYKWVPYDEESIPGQQSMAFDHRQMLLEFRSTLKRIFRESPVVFDLIGTEFTIPQIKALYEAVHGYGFTNFARYLMNRYKIISLDKQEAVNVDGRVGRPAILYKYLGPIDDT